MTAPTVFQVPGKMPEQLVEYWVTGKGAAKIRWGTDGSFDRCVRTLAKYFPRDPKGLCARLHKRATGEWPAEKGVESAADTEELATKKCPDGQKKVDGICVPDEDDDEYALTVDDADPDEQALVPMAQRWRSMLAPIGKPTGDKRIFEAGAITHRDLPLPLMFQLESGEGHNASVIVGRITDIDITDDEVNAAGDWLSVPEALRARELVDAGVLKPSVDLDDITYEIREPESGEKFDPNSHCTENDGCRPSQFVITQGRVSGATLVSIPAFAEVTFESFEEPDEAALLAVLDADFAADDLPCGCADTEEFHLQGLHDQKDHGRRLNLGPDIAREIRMTPPAGSGHVYDIARERLRVGDKPAEVQKWVRENIDNARVEEDELADRLDAAEERGDTNTMDNLDTQLSTLRVHMRFLMNLEERIGLETRRARNRARNRRDARRRAAVTAAAPAGPPTAWFEDPQLDQYTPIHVTDEGRLVGHIAAWGVCHTEYRVCVTPPDGDSFDEYHRYAVDTAEGWIKAGRLTVGHGQFVGLCDHQPVCNSDDHACGRLTLAQTIRHYDRLDTFAYARAGKDDHGIWVSGVPVPDVDMAAVLQRGVSGDWRDDGEYGLTLVEVMAVSTTAPAFPAPRAHLRADKQVSLVAAGAAPILVEEDPVFLRSGGPVPPGAAVVMVGQDGTPVQLDELVDRIVDQAFSRRRRRRAAYDAAVADLDTIERDGLVRQRDALLASLEV